MLKTGLSLVERRQTRNRKMARPESGENILFASFFSFFDLLMPIRLFKKTQLILQDFYYGQEYCKSFAILPSYSQRILTLFGNISHIPRL